MDSIGKVHSVVEDSGSFQEDLVNAIAGTYNKDLDFPTKLFMLDISTLHRLRKTGINADFRRFTKWDATLSDEFAGFYNCPVCGATEFRLIRRATNCRQFKCPSCSESVQLCIHECPCTGWTLGCLETPSIMVFYVHKNHLQESEDGQ